MDNYNVGISPLRDGAYFQDEDYTLDISFYTEKEKEKIYNEMEKGAQWRIEAITSINEKFSSGGLYELSILAFGLTKMNLILMKDSIQGGSVSAFTLEQAMRGVAVAIVYRRMKGDFNSKRGMAFYKKINEMTGEEAEKLLDDLLETQVLHDELQYFLDHPKEVYTLISNPGAIGVRLSENAEIIRLLESGINHTVPAKEKKTVSARPMSKQTSVPANNDSFEVSYAKELLHLIQEFKGVAYEEESSFSALKALDRNLSLLETAYKNASSINTDDLENDFLTLCSFIDTFKEALLRQDVLTESQIMQTEVVNRVLRLYQMFSNATPMPHTHYVDWMSLKLVQSATIDIISQEGHPSYSLAKEVFLKRGAMMEKIDEMRQSKEFLLQLTSDALRKAFNADSCEEILSLNSKELQEKLGELSVTISSLIFAL